MLMPYESFASNLAKLRTEIAKICAGCGRPPDSVSILPVTKNHPAEAASWVAQAGLPAVGENRVQEAREKRPAAPPGLRWELIGHLQSNKAKLAVALFERIQSVDSDKLLELLNRAAAEAGRVLPVLLQVNAGRDPAKFGCELGLTPTLVERALRCPNLRLEGFMAIAPLEAQAGDAARRTFETLRTTRDEMAAQFGVTLRELSMGMSGDLAEAIAAGSTQVRVGTALFGTRT
jgi:pyridoxal phosphate enzyme (YggS family)